MAEYVAPWQPAGARRERYRRPPVGAIIAVNRKPWRVVDHEELDVADWSEHERAGYLRHYADRMPPERWSHRPWILVLDELPDGRRHEARVSSAYTEWDVLPEHYPVCVHCRELHPCRHMTTEEAVARGQAALDRLTSIAPGYCWGCGDRITKRQKRISFDGPNLLLPGGHSPVEFHTRLAGSCSQRAYEYEQKWIAADPRRPIRLDANAREGA